MPLTVLYITLINFDIFCQIIFIPCLITIAALLEKVIVGIVHVALTACRTFTNHIFCFSALAIAIVAIKVLVYIVTVQSKNRIRIRDGSTITTVARLFLIFLFSTYPIILSLPVSVLKVTVLLRLIFGVSLSLGIPYGFIQSCVHTFSLS